MSPLSCILNQKYRIIIGCRSLIVNGRMTTFKIVGMNIFPNRFPCFTDIGILVLFLHYEKSYRQVRIVPVRFRAEVVQKGIFH